MKPRKSRFRIAKDYPAADQQFAIRRFLRAEVASDRRIDKAIRYLRSMAEWVLWCDGWKSTGGRSHYEVEARRLRKYLDTTVPRRRSRSRSASADYLFAVAELRRARCVARACVRTIEAKAAEARKAKPQPGRRAPNDRRNTMVIACIAAFEYATKQQATVSNTPSGRKGAVRDFVCIALPLEKDGSRPPSPDGIIEKAISKARAHSITFASLVGGGKPAPKAPAVDLIEPDFEEPRPVASKKRARAAASHGWRLERAESCGGASLQKPSPNRRKGVGRRRGR